MSTIIIYKGQRRGAGKTLSMTYQARKHFLVMRRCDRCGESFDFLKEDGVCPNCKCKDFHRYPIYANYKLNFPFKPLRRLEDLQKIDDAFVAIDEVWKYANARESQKKRNKFVSGILAESRHRRIDLAMTTQHENQIDIWVRRVTDMIAVPLVDKQTGICTLPVFLYHNNPYFWTDETHIDTYYFQVEPIFKLYNTWEIIQEMDMEEQERKDHLQRLKDEKKIQELEDEIVL